MAQVIALEFRQSCLAARILYPVDRRLVGIGRVVIQRDQIFQQAFYGAFSANGSNHSLIPSCQLCNAMLRPKLNGAVLRSLHSRPTAKCSASWRARVEDQR